MLELFARPHDPLAHLKREYILDVKPIRRLTSIKMKSPGKKVTVRGELGYLMLRGHHPMSVESQLFGMVKSGIVSSTAADCFELSGSYDYVVVANGSYDMSRKAGIWSQ